MSMKYCPYTNSTPPLCELLDKMIRVVWEHAAEICPECYQTFHELVQRLNDGDLRALVAILDYALSWIPRCREDEEEEEEP